MTDLRIQGLIITEEQWYRMLTDVQERVPEEACGLLAGKSGVVHYVTSVTNILHSSIRYRMAPEEQLVVFNKIDEQNLELIAIYHSHPNGPSELSETDLNEAYYPNTIQLIWFRQGTEWGCRGFIIVSDQVIEVPLKVYGKE